MGRQGDATAIYFDFRVLRNYTILAADVVERLGGVANKDGRT